MRSADSLELYPGDPILGLTLLHLADPRPEKVNLGVGVYLDEVGRIPLLASVATAEDRLAAERRPRGYLPIGGLPEYLDLTRALVFGAGSALVEEGRVAAVQTLGGSGALRIAGEFLRESLDATTVLLSTPSWGNHDAIFSGCGLLVERYRYLDPAAHRVDVDGMLADLAAAAPGTVVVLHACCHNPTGFDLDADAWARVARTCSERGLLPLVDMAYQGFGEGLDADRVGIETLAASGQPFVVASSFSKNMGLYGERIGSLLFVCGNRDEATRVESQLCRTIRSNYSNPPSQGARIVATVLSDDALRVSWEQELAAMRRRVIDMRAGLVASLNALGVESMDFITSQSGMFSFTGFTADEMLALRTDHAIYGTTDGRICVAGLGPASLHHVARSFAAVLAAR